MKQLTLNQKNYLFVEVPEDAGDFWINNAGCLRYSKLNGKISSVVSPEQMGVYLEKDKYLILGKASEVTEEQANGIVEKVRIEAERVPIIKFKNYENGIKFNYATESLYSLIRSIGMETEKTVIIQEKK